MFKKKKYLNSKQITVFNFRVLFCKAIIIGNCVNDTCINLLEKITVKNYCINTKLLPVYLCGKQ